MPAAVYVRQSQDRSGEGLGVQRQREDCCRVVEQRGWALAAEFTDNDVSAAGRKRRPGFEALVKAVERGEIGAIVAWSLDRLTRNRRDQLRLIEACEPTKVVISLVRGSDMDLSTPAGRLAADILASVARHEIEQKSDRQTRAQTQAAAQGRRVGGRRPFGYEADGVTVKPCEAQAIIDGYTSLLAGEPLAVIARRWNALGLRSGQTAYAPTRKGQPTRWSHATVRTVLCNGRNAGLRIYKGEPVATAVWPALVAEHVWRAACSMLEDPSRNRGGAGRLGRQLLTGIALCGVCGAPVHGGGASHRKPVYRCPSNAHVTRLAPPVEDYIGQVVVARLARPDAADLVADAARPDVTALVTEAAAVRQRQRVLAEEFADGALSPAQLRTANERMRARLAELESQLADAGRLSALTPLIQATNVQTIWNQLDVDRRRAIIDLLMTVRLHPPGRGTRRFNPTTVEITPKQPGT